MSIDVKQSLGLLDDRLGEWLERQVTAHHHRRLARRGWLRALDADGGGFASGSPPPRAGNDVEVLLDGHEALAAIAEAIEGAERRVWLAGWFFSPDFQLRHGDTKTLRDLLAGIAGRVDVRVLAWAGSPLPLFHPDRGEVRTMRDELVRGTAIACALDGHERPLHCHHEKLVIVDDATAFVGGIDLTSEGGDRLDHSHHPARGKLGWHDAAVRLRGPVAADVADHFRLRWHETTGERLPATEPPAEAGSTDVQLVRTVPEKIYRAVPAGDFRILESYLGALRSAQRLVYLENQFLWSPEVVAVLADKLRNPPTDEFRLLLVLPSKPNNGQDDTRGQLGVLAEADADAHRFLACTLYQRGRDAEPVYVHAKIGIVDDAWLTLGSANLNEHSLFNDSEVNVVLTDPELVRRTRLRLWSEHLECDAAELEGDPTEIFDSRWRPISREQLDRKERGEPLTHRLVRLPNVSRRSGSFLGPLNGLVVDG